MTKWIAVAIFLLAHATVVRAQQSDPLVGTWKLNLAKSKYDPGPAPQSAVHTYELIGKDTYKNSRDTVDATGKATHSELTITYDGKEHPVTRPTADATLDRRIDANNLEGMSMKEGRLVTIIMRSVSPDGKTLTFKQMGTDANGKPFSTMEVFDKQ